MDPSLDCLLWKNCEYSTLSILDNIVYGMCIFSTSLINTCNNTNNNHIISNTERRPDLDAHSK